MTDAAEALKNLVLSLRPRPSTKCDPKEDDQWIFQCNKNRCDKPPPAGNIFYVKRVLAKYEIADAVGIERHQFLTNVIKQFQLHVDTPINYVCFLYNYFQAVSKDDWENKTKILEQLEKALPKLKKKRKEAEELFYEWWEGPSTEQ